MNNQIHILNGDALRYQLSDIPDSQLIILREAFIDGPLNQKDFFKNRALYIRKNFDASLEEYKLKSEDELGKIRNLKADHEIILWFEYDLFCQCNMWYACHELTQLEEKPQISWVHPKHDSWSGFGKMGPDDLGHIYAERETIDENELVAFANIWTAYTEGNHMQIKSLAKSLSHKFPSLEATIEAHILRTDPNYLLDLSRSYLEDLTSKDFKSFYLKFSEAQGIYGFGDLHVKQFYDQVIKEI